LEEKFKEPTKRQLKVLLADVKVKFGSSERGGGKQLSMLAPCSNAFLSSQTWLSDTWCWNHFIGVRRAKGWSDRGTRERRSLHVLQEAKKTKEQLT